MNWKLILAFIVVFLVGAVIGGFGTKEYFDPEYQQAIKTLDSISIVEQERKRVFDSVLSKPIALIKKTRDKLKQRQNDFKNDTIMPTDDELIQRARAITNHD